MTTTTKTMAPAAKRDTWFSDVDPVKMGERVRKLRESMSMTQAALSKFAGTSQQGINNLEKGLVKLPRNIETIAKTLGTTTEYLTHGRASRTGIPVIQASGSNMDSIAEYLTTAELAADTKFVKATNRVSKAAFGLFVADRACTPQICVDDILIIDPDVAPAPGDYVGIVPLGHSTNIFIRQVRETRPGELSFVPVDPNFPIFDAGSGKVVGVVVETRRLRVA